MWKIWKKLHSILRKIKMWYQLFIHCILTYSGKLIRRKKLHCFCGCHFVRRAINNNIYIAPRANGTYQEQLPQNRVLCMWWMTCQMPIEILQPLCASSSASLKRTPFWMGNLHISWNLKGVTALGTIRDSLSDIFLVAPILACHTSG